MRELDLDDLRSAFGFGVAGNFAGHLEQSGEAADFAGVPSASGEAPKGIFPWYVPGADTFLGVFPLSHDRLVRPAAVDGGVNLQIEPEVALLCDVAYAPDGGVEALAPRALGAFDDCSIRRPGAAKISHKKNWGPTPRVSPGASSTCGIWIRPVRPRPCAWRASCAAAARCTSTASTAQAG